MNLVWIVLIIIAIGFLGGSFVFSKERLPAIIRDMFISGWEFILAGLLIGPLGLNIIGVERLEQLDPFIALGLGWVGLIFGTQLRVADIFKVDRSIIKLTAIQALIVWLGLFLLFLFPALLIAKLSWSEAIVASCIVAAASAISSPTVLSLLAPEISRVNSAAIRSLRVVATLDVAPALLMIGLVFCFFPAQAGGEFLIGRGAWFLLFSVIMAVALALLFHNFGREGLSGEQDLCVFIGFVVFVSGIAFYLNLSPLFLSLLTGAVLANILKPDDTMFTMMYATEKPFYVILLIVTGLWWHAFGPMIWIIAGSIVSARLWLKIFGVEKGSKYLPENKALPKHSGLALGSQGALALAIGLNYLLAYPGDGPSLVFGVIVSMVIINDILAPFFIRRVMSGDEP